MADMARWFCPRSRMERRAARRLFRSDHAAVGSLVSVLVIGLLATGCSGNSDRTTESATTTEAPGASTPATRPTTTGVAALEVAAMDVTIDAGPRSGVPVRIWSPIDGGPYPVVVMSHGGGGSGAGYEYLVREWAESGYVVLLPTHRDSLALQRQAGIDVATGFEALRSDIDNPAAWEQRALDVTAVIDRLPEIGDLVPDLAGRVDPSRVAVAGHSFGAFTAMLVAGVEPEAGGEVISVRDERPVAFLLLSPQGVGQQGLTVSSFRNLDRPTLVMTGTLDQGQTARTADGAPQSFEDKLDPFELSPPGEKTAVIIEGATHFTFSGPGSGRALSGVVGDNPDTAPETYDTVVWATLGFLAQHLAPADAGPVDSLVSEDAPSGVVVRRR